MLFTYVACLLCAGIVAFFIKYSLRRKLYCKQVPTFEPNFFNVLGDLFDFVWCKNRHLECMDTLMKRSKAFRKQGFTVAWFFYQPLVFPLNAKAVKEVLKEKRIIEKKWLYNFLKAMVGDCLLISPVEKWKVQRKLLAPCFSVDVLRDYMVTFNEESQKLVAALQEETKKDYTIISEKISVALLDMASESIFGGTLGATKAENEQYRKSFRRFSDIFMQRVVTPWLMPDFLFWKSSLGKEMVHHQNVMQEITRSIIAEKRTRYLNGEKTTLKGRRKAMLDLLLEKHFETQEISLESIREHLDLFLLAGHDTVASSITRALFLLGHHPEIQAKVQEELDRVFGDDRERSVTEEDLKELQYLDCVVKESLRIYPGVPIFGREMTNATTINGYPVPKGTTCIVFSYGLHRDEEVFPDPEKFDPDRFSPENSAKIPDCAYIPFAAGPRNCIGYRYAEIEIRIIISWILRQFTVESLDSREKAQPIANISLQSLIPIRIRMRSRSIPKPA